MLWRQSSGRDLERRDPLVLADQPLLCALPGAGSIKFEHWSDDRRHRGGLLPNQAVVRVPKYLMVNSDTDFPQDWRLPEPVDEVALQGVLHRAMRTGEVIEVEIVVGEGTNARRSMLLLNGAKLSTAVVVELVKPPPAFRLLGDQS